MVKYRKTAIRQRQQRNVTTDPDLGLITHLGRNDMSQQAHDVHGRRGVLNHEAIAHAEVSPAAIGEHNQNIRQQKGTTFQGTRNCNWLHVIEHCTLNATGYASTADTWIKGMMSTCEQLPSL